MISSRKSGSSSRRLVGRVALVTLCVGSLGAAYAFKTVFARPGESALRLVPADAWAVATVDLSPSPAQALTFKKIDDALKRNGFDKFVQGVPIDELDPSAGMKEIRGFTQRSAAVAVLPPQSGNASKSDRPSIVVFVSISDGAAVNQIMQKQGVPQFYKGVKSFKMSGGKATMAVMDDLLVMSTEAQSIYRIQQVRNGDANVLSVADFQAARQQIAGDANVMGFVNPKMFTATNKSMGGFNFGTPGGDFSTRFGNQWIAMGAAVRDNGIEMSVSGKANTEVAKDMEAIFKMVSVRSDLFKILPTGSYGMIALSQPASYFEGLEKTLNKDANTEKGLKEMEAKMPEEVGMDLRRDLLPAFKGDTVLAAYPGQSGTGGLDLLLVIDDLNGADPVNAAKRLQDFAIRKTAKDANSPPLMASMKVEGADEAFVLSDDVQTEMRKSMGQSMENSGIKRDVMMGDKTFVWAVLGKSLVASTHKGLLEKAIATLHSQGANLSTDPNFASVIPSLMDGSQILSAFSFSRISEGFRATVGQEKMDAKGSDMYNSVLDALQGLAAPLFIKTKTSPDGSSSMGMFIPLDYDKMIDLAGKAKK